MCFSHLPEEVGPNTHINNFAPTQFRDNPGKIFMFSVFLFLKCSGFEKDGNLQGTNNKDALDDAQGGREAQHSRARSCVSGAGAAAASRLAAASDNLLASSAEASAAVLLP